MNCIIDQGNTKTKVYFFKQREIVAHHSFLNEEKSKIEETLSAAKFEKGIYSSSSSIATFIDRSKFILLDHTTPIPIQLNYKTPQTLGTDRIALAVGASDLFPTKHCLIISAGTCITVDLMDKDGVYQGGIISPGIDMRRKAMHEQTSNLPLLDKKRADHFPLLGKSTAQSMESGIFNGTVAEITETIHQFKSIYNDLTVIITGGDAYLFEIHLKNEIFAQQNLQAIGLNRILSYNAD